MKAAVLEKPDKITIKDIPQRVCKEDEVLVKVKACGICGSDLKYYKGDNPWALHTLGRHVDNPPNIILGHEFAGEVVDTGSSAFKHLLGKRVFVEPYNTCGMCVFCRTGRYNLCKDTKHIGHGAGWPDMDYFPGGMAEYCQVWGTHVYELPDNISFIEATILDPLAVAIHAISISGFSPGDNALIMGTGPVGNCIAQVLKAFGSGRIFCTDMNDCSLSIARKVGIENIIDIRDTCFIEFIEEKNSGRGVDLIFDTTGDVLSQERAINLLFPGGTFVNLVTNSNKMNFSLTQLSGERSIKTSSNNMYSDVLTAINLLSSGNVCVLPFITHQMDIDHVNEGFNLLFNKNESRAFKVVILP